MSHRSPYFLASGKTTNNDFAVHGANRLRQNFVALVASYLFALVFGSNCASKKHFSGLLIALVFWAGCWTANAAGRAPRVLFLNAFNNINPAPTTVDQAVRGRLKERSPVRIDTYTEYLDLIRFPGDAHELRTAAYLAEKYAQTPPDIVMVFADASLNFAIKYRELLAPNAPIIYSSVSATIIATIDRPEKIVGITLALDYAQTLALAERVQPNARNLVVISGASDSDRQWLIAAHDQLKPHESRFNTRYLTGIALEALLAEVSHLPRETIVIYTTVFGDGTGRQFVPAEVVENLTKVSSAPIYAASDTYLGRGIVGGYMDTHESMGIAMADMALEILTGRDPNTIVPHKGNTYAFRVDARQLKHWNLSDANLPAGTIVSFKQATLWNEHRNLILAVIAAFGLQTAIVTYVLLQNRRRRQAERSLAETEERMAFSATSTSTGLWQIETKDWSFWATDHCRALFGFAAETRLSLEVLLNNIHPEDRAAFNQTMRSSLQLSRPIDTEFRVVKSDGGIRWIAAKGHPLDNNNGRSACISGIFTDITALKMAEGETELQRREVAHLMRQSVLGELSGAIAHELNQPLTAILANAETAQDIIGGNDVDMDLDQVQDILKDIIEDDKRADQVIRRLRKLLKKGESKSEPINLNQLIESTLDLLHGELVRRKINIDVALAAELPESFGDSVQLQQVLLNLIMNAIEAMSAKAPSQRELFITTRVSGTKIEAAIIDCGPGLSSTVETQLFQPFFTTKKFGLGLGLSICSTIVKSHGGELRIQNNVGEGATAIFVLPTQKTIALA